MIDVDAVERINGAGETHIEATIDGNRTAVAKPTQVAARSKFEEVLNLSGGPYNITYTTPE